jgi:hypothetical protein
MVVAVVEEVAETLISIVRQPFVPAVLHKQEVVALAAAVPEEFAQIAPRLEQQTPAVAAVAVACIT